MRLFDRLALAALLILALAQLVAPPPAEAGICPGRCSK